MSALVVFRAYRGAVTAINPDEVSTVTDEIGYSYNKCIVRMRNGEKVILDGVWASDVIRQLWPEGR